jgi:hypothetical protein
MPDKDGASVKEIPNDKLKPPMTTDARRLNHVISDQSLSAFMPLIH